MQTYLYPLVPVLVSCCLRQVQLYFEKENECLICSSRVLIFSCQIDIFSCCVYIMKMIAMLSVWKEHRCFTGLLHTSVKF